MPNHYASDGSVIALTGSHALFEFGFAANKVRLTNDDTESIFYKWRAGGTEQELKASETKTWEDEQTPVSRGIYLRGTTGGEDYRLEAW